MSQDDMDLDHSADLVQPYCSNQSTLGNRVSETCSLQDCIQGFGGHAKVQRLLFIADQCPGETIALDALHMAHDDIKEASIDTELYKKVVGLIDGRGGTCYEEDSGWLEHSESVYIAMKEDLERRLVTAKSALDQRHIAALEKEYGDLLCRKGSFSEGMKHYVRIREYSKDMDDVTGMMQRAVTCAFYMKNYFSIIHQSRKMDMFPKDSVDSSIVARVRMVAALTHVALGAFDVAARTATTLSHDTLISSPDIVSSSAFSLCMILSAIASLERKDLESIAVTTGFQAVLDLAPPHARDAFAALRSARYGHVLSLLEDLKPLVWIDHILVPHMTSLYNMTHDRCLCEYSSAFCRISLSRMADIFKTPERELERRLANLIQRNKLRGKIDAQAREVLLQHDSIRSQTFSTAVQTADMFVRDSMYLTLRSQMIRSGLIKSLATRTAESCDLEDEPCTLDAEREALPDISTQETTQQTQ